MTADRITLVSHSTGYARFIPGWVDGLLALPRRPDRVCLFTHGTEEDANAGVAAVRRLAPVFGVLNVRHEHEERRLPIGEAKNRAVAMSATPWVLPLDIDDTLLPAALEVWEALAPEADLVAFGYERWKVTVGSPDRLVGSRLYVDAEGLGAVARWYPASGNWPFRRWLWERRPFRAILPGAWDTASLIEWGHLGARVRASRVPCFRYRRHATSVLTLRRKQGGFAHRWTELCIRALHHGQGAGDRGVSVIFPRSAVDPADRERARATVRAWYARHFPTWELLDGEAPRGPWCKGAAVEAALAHARCDTLVIADADCLVDPAALRQAVAAVQQGAAPWAIPHGPVLRLRPGPTAEVLAGKRDPFAPVAPQELERPAYQGLAGGGLFVVSRLAYTAIGGIPRHFVGWGGEDQAVAAILTATLGAPKRGAAPLVHLWHTPQNRRAEARQNGARLRQLRQAAAHGPESLYRYLLTGVRPPVQAAGEPSWKRKGRERQQKRIAEAKAQGKSLQELEPAWRRHAREIAARRAVERKRARGGPP